MESLAFSLLLRIASGALRVTVQRLIALNRFAWHALICIAYCYDYCGIMQLKLCRKHVVK